jgi:hypothetical protein
LTKRDDEPFLDRWSRRKRAARRGETLPAEERASPPPAPAVPPPLPERPAAASNERPPELPSLDSLKGIASDYKDFMRPEVDAATRSAALKKLFVDPHFHFNQMDGLDVYIDDYSKAEVLPSATLRLMNQARSLGLFEEEEKKADAETPQLPQPESTQLAQAPDTSVAETPSEEPAAKPRDDA